MTTDNTSPDSPLTGAGTRILVPLDGSDLAAKALPVAEALCRQLSAHLDLVSVLSPTIIPFVGGEPYIPGEVYQQIDTERTQAAQVYLASAAKSLSEQGIAVETHLERGDAALRLLDLAKELRSTLVVMTTHGRTGLARFALGSVADRVVRAGVSPVLLLRSFPSPAHGTDLSHALIPLDGSLAAETPVFTLVPLLAGTVLHTITLLRIADPRDGEAGRQLCENYLQAVRQRLVDRLGDRDCAISTLVRSTSNPAASIVECSRDGECDLVLMATHGEAGIGRWALGGVTDRVVRDGNTPILLMHPPRK
jgi:nucleotide-binding universal stress UspA family protein